MRRITERYELIFLLIGRNLKIRYKNSVLGFFWSLLTPLFLILIYATFAHILRFSGSRPFYLQFLIVGIIIWQFLAMCLNDSLHAVIGNANLIKKTAFPRIILPLSMMLANFVNFLLTGIVLFVYLIFAPVSFSSPAWLPLILLTHCALCLGMALLISTTNVFFRDTEHILSILILAWFFLTPIFYDVQTQLGFLPAGAQWLAYLNPMTGIVSAYRAVLMSDPMPALHLLFVSTGVAWLILGLGVVVFQRCESRFADEL